jgi:hypothetical protein
VLGWGLRPRFAACGPRLCVFRYWTFWSRSTGAAPWPPLTLALISGFVQAAAARAAALFRFLRQPSRPKPPRPVAKSGRADGRGAVVGARPQKLVSAPVLYGGGHASGTLYSVNPSTGVLTTIGSGSLTYWATRSTTSGLFAVDNSPNVNLYSINPNTGAASLIGPTGLSPSAIVEGMSTGSDSLPAPRQDQ